MDAFKPLAARQIGRGVLHMHLFRYLGGKQGLLAFVLCLLWVMSSSAAAGLSITLGV